MKKLKHEAELFKAALVAGMKYAEGRKAAEFEPSDTVSERLLFHRPTDVALAKSLAQYYLDRQDAKRALPKLQVCFKDNAKELGKNLMAAVDVMPGDKFGFKPTPAQMSFGDIAMHLAQGNDYLCGAIGGMKAPQRTKVSTADTKEVISARLKETFAFCDQALAAVDDSKLAEEIPFFGGKNMTRAAIMTITTGDWADHYSQQAIYLRLNDQLPPTARKVTK